MKVDLTPYRRYIREELTPDKKERGKYACPICGSGTRSGGDGAFSIDKDEIHGKCFACGFYGDIFDLYAARDGITLEDATREVIAKYGKPDAAPAAYTKAVEVSKPTPQTADQASRKKAAEYVLACYKAMQGSPATAYLQRRGISQESINRYRLGYDAQNNRLIIPHDPAGSYYIARDLSGAHGVPKYMNPKGLEAILFNAAALYTDEPCFVVESDLCAISIEQEGGKAVALAGTGGQSRLLAQIRQQKPTAPALIVSLDNDAKGQEAALKLIAELEKQGIPVLQANISGDEKDPNEALTADRETFHARVAGAITDAADRLNAEKRLRQQLEEQARADYLASCTSNAVENMFIKAREKAKNPAIPTGFPSLDRRLDGGLYPGLYVLGAISSLGKTSFALQIADQVARNGNDVMIFSLEMSRDEIMAKSISRLTYTISRSKKGDGSLGKSTRGILAGGLYKHYNDEELETIADAIDQYKQDYGAHIWVIEGIGDVGVAKIRDEVEKHIRFTGRRPLVIVDYLQILHPSDPHDTDKRATDKNVLELKRMSRDLDIPVLGISALNRDNYLAPINMAAFKESGAIEYGTDALFGLQYVGMDYEESEGDKQREKRIRELRKENDEKAAEGKGIRLEIKILKNRNGTKGACDPLIFTPRYNHFAEEATPQGFSHVTSKTPFDKPQKRSVL
ncbi:MAG: toprim domain-containing protein [Clostridia bacterium]|nr:toprim domain-containing protein [Clostridia bacterium]